MNMARRYENNMARQHCRPQCHQQGRPQCRPQGRPQGRPDGNVRSRPASGPCAGNNRPTRPASRHRSPNPVPQLSGGKALPHEKVVMLQAWARYHPRKTNFLPRVGMHTGPLTAFQIVKLTMFSPIKFNMDPSDPRYVETRTAIAHINSWILPKRLKVGDTTKYLARAGLRPGHDSKKFYRARLKKRLRSSS